MFGQKTSALLLILVALVGLCVIIGQHATLAQEEGGEGDVPLKRGPRQGFERDAEEERDDVHDEEWEDDEEEEEEEEIEEEDWSIPAGGEKPLGTIEWSTPDLDNDYHSPHLPSDMKCDACTIVTSMMADRLDKANQKRPSLKKKLPESMIIEVLEELCNDKFNEVGVKEINGKQRLSGPGSKIKDVTGIMQGGGKWPFRLLQMCEGYLGEFGEEDLYQFYLDGTLKKKLCNGPKGVCRKRKEERKEKKKEKDGGKKKGKGKGKGKKTKEGKKVKKGKLEL